MADSDIQITAGSGTKVDTRTVGAGADEHRQVVCIGDPTTTTGVAVVDETASDNESASTPALVTNARLKLFNGTGWDRARGDTTNGIDVDVTRIVPGVGPTHLGKQEDQPHADGDTGILMLGVRNHLTGSTTDGDYSAISVSSTGELQTLARRDTFRVQASIAGITATAYTAGQQLGNIISFANATRLSNGTGTIVGATLQTYSDVVGGFDLVFFDQSVTLAGNNVTWAIADADISKVIGVVPLGGAYDIGNNRICQSLNIAMPYWCSGSTTLYASLICRTAFTMAADLTSFLTIFVERN